MLIEIDRASFCPTDVLDGINETSTLDFRKEFSSYFSEEENDSFEDDINVVEEFPDFSPKENVHLKQNSSESANLNLKNPVDKENIRNKIINFPDASRGKCSSMSKLSKDRNLILSIKQDNYTVSIFKDEVFPQDNSILKEVLCSREQYHEQYKMSPERTSSDNKLSQFNAQREKSSCQRHKNFTFSSVKTNKSLPNSLKKKRNINISRRSYFQSTVTLKKPFNCKKYERPTFRCDVCKLTVTSKSNLKSHLTRIHFKRAQSALPWRMLLRLITQ